MVIAGWWFQIFGIFHAYLEYWTDGLIFVGVVETINQRHIPALDLVGERSWTIMNCKPWRPKKLKKCDLLQLRRGAASWLPFATSVSVGIFASTSRRDRGEWLCHASCRFHRCSVFQCQPGLCDQGFGACSSEGLVLSVAAVISSH